ncbi:MULTISPECIES: CAP domain-containing protein [Flavobacterium]|jgi:uncharacterized protein YkwD|uniref:CAP domain-containing protein n=1 Tax=Flavobacterium stagni TaxID=2506421 RepID=A0A4Q1K813_9FLAO|nr:MULTISPECIES: CAP domain-containing protein [Flavobacterium]RXR21426.1 CAP domain-containing protein [Flavobacterium stagni]
MKAKLLRLFLPIALVFTMVSCSKDTDSDSSQEYRLVTSYDYSAEESDLIQRINDYRESIGKSRLQIVNHISYKSYEHNEYMIDNNVVNHDYFDDRVNNIKHVLGAVRVGENVAYNFSSPTSVLNAWLNSPGHKANIEGDYTHFGVSISVNPTTGKRYYTNIFMKK